MVPNIAAGGFESDTADEIIEKGDAGLVRLRTPFYFQPDLPGRIREGLSLNPYDRPTFYGGDARGYSDLFYQKN